MNDFQEVLARFRDAIHQEGERSESPGLHAILQRERPSKRLRLRWALAAVVILALGGIPAYVNGQRRQREAAREAADRVLLQQVHAGLSRSAARAMQPLMGWTPGD